VLLNGKPIPRGYRRLVAYVMQDDILPGTMSPRELFMFAANLRLPSYVCVGVSDSAHASVCVCVGVCVCVCVCVIHRERERSLWRYRHGHALLACGM
jgi:hypothetical protein